MITETGRRRCFSKDDKARIVEETLVPGAVVSEIARRHGPTQKFTWRRQARLLPTPMADSPFVPAVVDAMVPAMAVGHERKTARRKAKPDIGGIEIEAEGATIRVGRGADVALIRLCVGTTTQALQQSRSTIGASAADRGRDRPRRQDLSLLQGRPAPDR